MDAFSFDIRIACPYAVWQTAPRKQIVYRFPRIGSTSVDCVPLFFFFSFFKAVGSVRLGGFEPEKSHYRDFPRSLRNMMNGIRKLFPNSTEKRSKYTDRTVDCDYCARILESVLLFLSFYACGQKQHSQSQIIIGWPHTLSGDPRRKAGVRSTCVYSMYSFRSR